MRARDAVDRKIYLCGEMWTTSNLNYNFKDSYLFGKIDTPLLVAAFGNKTNNQNIVHPLAMFDYDLKRYLYNDCLKSILLRNVSVCD